VNLDMGQFLGAFTQTLQQQQQQPPQQAPQEASASPRDWYGRESQNRQQPAIAGLCCDDHLSQQNPSYGYGAQGSQGGPYNMGPVPPPPPTPFVRQTATSQEIVPYQPQTQESDQGVAGNEQSGVGYRKVGDEYEIDGNDVPAPSFTAPKTPTTYSIGTIG